MIGGDAFDIKTGSPSTFDLMKQVFSDKALEQVKYLGKVPYEEMKRHIQSAHVCVFPSLAESFGMVTIEAMAMKKTVVNSNYGWAKEIIDNSVNGILEDPKDIQNYANAVCDVLLNDADCEKISENARKKIEEKFDMSVVTKLNIEFYQKVIQKTNART
jgi:glycosyltransferase involved in cell wall biosynthesis